MGMIHYLAAQRASGLKSLPCAAVTPRSSLATGRASRAISALAAPQMDLSGVSCYQDFESCWPIPTVDLVDLCVPNDSHAAMAIQALRAGKHVLVEKPIALSTERSRPDGRGRRERRESCSWSGTCCLLPRVCICPRCRSIAADSASLQAAHLYRVISKPDWSSGIADAGRSGGPAIDLHIHDTHFIALACGTPPRRAFEGHRPRKAPSFT